MRMRATWLFLVAMVSLTAVPALAADWGASSSPYGYQPQVPISALARPVAWLDPTRFHISESFSVGSGYGGSSALSVTSLSYQFRMPMWLNVSMGNAWGSSMASNGSPFLEGVDFGFRPMSSMLVRIQYRDFRTPLQYDAFANPTRLWPY